MHLTTRDFPLAIKAAAKSGRFEGHASLFGVVDSYNDRVMPGAFTDSLADWKTKGRMPPLLWAHNTSEPIGVFRTMTEDAKGLRVEGELLIGSVSRAKEVHALVEAGAVSGLSIGFQTLDDDVDEAGVRELKRIALWECSLVCFPALDDARVDSIKKLLFDSPRSFERAVRDALGLSAREAKRLAAGGRAALVRKEPDEAELSRMAAGLDAITQLLRT